MECKGCNNEARLKLVPSNYNYPVLCVSCYNIQQFYKGKPYICNYCSYTCLRVHYNICCDICHELLEAGIDKIKE